MQGVHCIAKDVWLTLKCRSSAQCDVTLDTSASVGVSSMHSMHKSIVLRSCGVYVCACVVWSWFV